MPVIFLFAVLLLRAFSPAAALAGGTIQTIQQAVPGYDQLKPQYQARMVELFIHKMQGAPMTEREQWLMTNYGFLLAANSAESGKPAVARLLFKNGEMPAELTAAATAGRNSVDFPEKMTDPDIVTKALKARDATMLNENPRTDAEWAALRDENSKALTGMISQATFSASSPAPSTRDSPRIGAPEPTTPDAGLGGGPSGGPGALSDGSPGSAASGSPGGSSGVPSGGTGASANGGGGPSSGASSHSLAGNKALAALKGEAFGPEKRDSLPDPKTANKSGRGAGPDGAPSRAEGSAGSPGAASSAGPISAKTDGGSLLAAGPGFGPSSAGSPGGPSGARAATAPPGGDPRGGMPGGPGLTAGGSNGGMGSLGGPRAGGPGAAEPGAPSASASRGKGADAGDEAALTEDEKKELKEIQDLLKNAGKDDKDGALDAGALASAADLLPESPVMQRIKDKIKDMLAMSGGELSMGQRQEVYALASRLGLSTEEAQALVHAVERGEPPPPSASRPSARWLIWWLWIKRALLGWWRRLLVFLHLSSAAPRA